MSRWSNAAARLNRAADDFYAEEITILRPPAGSAYVKPTGDPVELRRVQGVISEGEGMGPADGDVAGDRTFNQQLAAGEIQASFMRTRFASRAEWPLKGDLLHVETGPRAGDIFEALDAAGDDGERVNVAVARRS